MCSRCEKRERESIDIKNVPRAGQYNIPYGLLRYRDIQVVFVISRLEWITGKQEFARRHFITGITEANKKKRGNKIEIDTNVPIRNWLSRSRFYSLLSIISLFNACRCVTLNCELSRLQDTRKQKKSVILENENNRTARLRKLCGVIKNRLTIRPQAWRWLLK